jgi:hypothetical protein
MGFLSLTRIIREEKKRAKELKENELNAALAVPTDDRLWRALHQLIDTAEENAHENAWANMDPGLILAGYVGGAAHLKMLREELLSRREDGLKLLGGTVNRPDLMNE